MNVLLLLTGIAWSTVSMECAALSVYRPGDGWNAGELACGGKFTMKQRHVAVRRWRKYGCRSKVLLLHPEFLVATVRIMDAGPFGIYKPPLHRAVQEGRWRVWTKRNPPTGWKWRGAVDLSYQLWLDLGRPRPLSRVCVVYPALPRRKLRTLLMAVSSALPAFAVSLLQHLGDGDEDTELGAPGA